MVSMAEYNYWCNAQLQEADSTLENGCIKIAAIDNGLAFPYKHPDEWRACKST